jgi:NAD(P)-dependent dehydrogenase (short-subunit alcohol dehydrogenase family)
MIDLGLHHKRAVVAGAGYLPARAGHGRLTALRLAEAGARVACVDIDEDRARSIVAEICDAGGEAFPVLADMTDRRQVERAIDEVVVHLGGIDVCVNIIGGAKWEKVEEFSDDDWAWSIQNNLTVVFYLFQTVGRQMMQQGTGGSLVSLSSVDGTAAAMLHAPYGAAKAGVISLTKSFAQEFGRYGIRVNSVAPGNVVSGNEDQPNNEFAVSPINPLAAPRAGDIANAVLFLSSGLAERITGQTLVVDGGATVRDVWGLTEDVLPRFRTGIYG